ncbi:MAG: peroxide stress protein YaaA [Pseudomonadales bacterium]|jgi:hypothetical protein
MLFIVSPAKNLDMQRRFNAEASAIRFPEDTQELVGVMRGHGPESVAKLMKLSDKLAHLNHERYLTFNQDDNPGTHALAAFNGDVYQGLDASSMSDAQLAFANQHLRILSGLYGVLRPLDDMKAYRLEMGTKLQTERGKNLYEFWGNKVTQALIEDAKVLGTDTLVNLASNEYSGVVDLKGLGLRVITPVFKDEKNGTFKIISFYAKKARGLMARYLIDHQITEAEGIKGFDVDGYQFNPGMSEGDTWVFTRAAQ